MPLKLQVIICSTRPGRVGESVARWFYSYAQEHSDFDVELVDLAQVNLPMYDEPKHPVLKQYEKEHTKRWSEIVESADAYVFVAPEYNYSPTPALVNALNYVYREWNYKPCGFVSYGGSSGGLRGAQAARFLVPTLRLMASVEGVDIPAVGSLIDRESGQCCAYELIVDASHTMRNELSVCSAVLRGIRA